MHIPQMSAPWDFRPEAIGNELHCHTHAGLEKENVTIYIELKDLS